MGACLFYPKETYSDSWFFSMGINAGQKFISVKVGLRLQAQGLMPIQGTAFALFAGSGGSVAVFRCTLHFSNSDLPAA